MLIWALDDHPYDHTGREVVAAAHARGHKARLFRDAFQTRGTEGYAYARPHQWEPFLTRDRREILKLKTTNPRLKLVQDEQQVRLYENKLAQAEALETWLPETWVFTDQTEALQFVTGAKFPIISKSSVGSASHNVRILRTPKDAIAEVELAFGKGIPVVAGGGGAKQHGYVLWQRFVAHNVTCRVTRVGNKFHAYARYNYEDRPMAAPAKVKATTPLLPAEFFESDGDEQSLAEFSEAVTEDIGSKWIALDIVWDREYKQWRLLETALAWARGNDASGNAKFYGTDFSLLTQHELLIEQIERGVFG